MIVEEESAKSKVKNTSSKKPDARLNATVKPDLAIKLEQAPAKKKSIDSSKAL